MNTQDFLALSQVVLAGIVVPAVMITWQLNTRLTRLEVKLDALAEALGLHRERKGA